MKKQFTLTVAEENGQLSIDGDNKGFNALELIGLLALKLGDIIDQVNEPTKFTRTATDGDSTFEITDKKEEPVKKGHWYSDYDPIRRETKLQCSICGSVVRYEGMLTRYPDKCDLCKSTMEVMP